MGREHWALLWGDVELWQNGKVVEMALSRSSALPLHTQLRGWLLEQLQSGKYQAGDVLPTERELEEMHGVSRVTVRRALGDLAAAGYIVRQAGRGSIVLQRKIRHSAGGLGGLSEELRSQGMEVTSKMLEFGLKAPPLHIARLLGVGEGVPLLHHYRLFLVNGQPFSLGSGYENIGTDPGEIDEEQDPEVLITALRRKGGIVLKRVERSMEATPASKKEAGLLNTRPGKPMLVAELLIFDDQDRPVAYRRGIYRGESYRYVHTLLM